jgi:hypothetical protein
MDHGHPLDVLDFIDRAGEDWMLGWIVECPLLSDEVRIQLRTAPRNVVQQVTIDVLERALEVVRLNNRAAAALSSTAARPRPGHADRSRRRPPAARCVERHSSGAEACR